MEQSDLAQFHFYEADSDSGMPGFLTCGNCEDASVKSYEFELGVVPNLLQLMEDAAAHFAQVHRKSNDGS